MAVIPWVRQGAWNLTVFSKDTPVSSDPILVCEQQVRDSPITMGHGPTLQSVIGFNRNNVAFSRDWPT